MSIKINYTKKKIGKISSNLVLFVNDKFDIKGLKNCLTNQEYSYINDLLKNSDLKKKILLIFEVNSKKKIILISIKNNLKFSDIENLGAELFTRINYGKNNEYFLNSESVIVKNENFLDYFLHGLKLKSYEFKKYKTKKIQEYFYKCYR